MTVRLLTEHHLEFPGLNGSCTGSSESTLSKCHVVGNTMPWLICSCRSVCFNQITEHTAQLLPTQLQTRTTHALIISGLPQS